MVCYERGPASPKANSNSGCDDGDDDAPPDLLHCPTHSQSLLLLLPDPIDSLCLELADFAGRGVATPFTAAPEVCVARRPLWATCCQTTGMTTKMTLALATSAP